MNFKIYRTKTLIRIHFDFQLIRVREDEVSVKIN